MYIVAVMKHSVSSALSHDSRGMNVQALKDEVRLMGWDNLLDDMEWPTRLAEGGTLATRGAGGEMTSCFALGLYELPFVLGIILLAIELDAELLVRLSGIAATGGARLRPATIQGCRIAGPGFIRRSGSQVRHLLMKSINSSSLHLSTWASVFEFGRRRLPFALTNGRGAPVASICQP